MDTTIEIISAVIIAGAIIASIIVSARQTRQSNEMTRQSNEMTRQSNELSQKSNEMTRQSNEHNKIVFEIDLIFRLNDRIYESDTGKKIIEMAKNPDAIIVDADFPENTKFGSLNHREVENYLNNIEMACTLKQQNILTSKMFEQAFTWVIDLMVENHSIMRFIKSKQGEFGDVAWKPISDYYESKIRKERNG